MSRVSRAQSVRSVLFLFLVFPLVLYVLTMLLFWADIPISIFHIPVAITICAVLTLYLDDWSHWKIIGGGAVALAAYLAILILLQYFFYDISWDGRQYHGTAIEQMTMGWNPVYERLVSDVWTSYEWKVWINTMPKFPWVIGACVYKITDAINTVKIITPYYAIVIFFGLYWLLYKPVRSKAIAAVVAGAVVGNPVMLSQVFTNYIDGLGYFLFLIFAVCGFLVANGQGNRMETCLLLLSFIGIAATKLSILIPTLAFLGCLLCVSRVRTEISNKKVFIGFAVIAFLALYTPHLKNLLYYGSPIYPFSSSPIVGGKAEYPANIAPKAGLVDCIFKINLPKFTSTSTPALFVESIFSKVSNTLDKTSLKLPFTFEKSEWEQFTMSDVRCAGFGPLFSGALVVSFFLLAWGLLRQRSRMLYVCFGAGALALLLAAITQGSWWARYVPYVWCVPIVFVLPFIFSSASSIMRYGAYLVISLLFINCLIVAKYNFIYQLKNSIDISRYYNAIHDSGDIIKNDCIMNLDEIYLREKDIYFYCKTIEFEQIFASICVNKSLYSRKDFQLANTNPYKMFEDFRIFGVSAEVKEDISEEDKKELAACFAVPYKLPVERISPIKLLVQYGQTIWKHF